jgi:multiple sugar transport system substrate-binding protein
VAGGRARGSVGRALCALGLVTAGLVACGGDEGGTPTLSWYAFPEPGGTFDAAAEDCTEAAGGRYRIDVKELPTTADGQREQLVRRLAANDTSIDLMSLDPPYIPEFAQAGFLAPVPQDLAARVTEGVVQSSIDSATWNDELVAVPFWANTQLLWYRKSVAEAAGLDMSQPVTWDQLVQVAQEQGTTIAAQGIRAEALTVWLNALIESGGGSIIAENSTDPDEIQLGLTSEAGVRAAEVMRSVSEVGGPAFSTSGEDANVTDFEQGDAGFMVNWPFVWQRALTAVEAGTLDASVPADYGWALYPQVDPDDPSAPPYGGINLGIGAFSEDVDAAYEAAECIVSEENQTYYFTTNGNPAAKAAVYDDPAVLEAFPMAPVIRQSLEQAAPRPQTVYYNEVSGGLQRTYHPASSIDPQRTPEQATELIEAVLRGDQLL